MIHKKLGMDKDYLATKAIPFLFPLAVEPGLNFSQVICVTRLNNGDVIDQVLKNALYLSVNVFSTKVLINWGHYSFVKHWRRDDNFTWSSEPREGSVAAYSAQGVLISQLFKDSEYWCGPWNRTRDLPLCSQALYRLSWSCCGRSIDQYVVSFYYF